MNSEKDESSTQLAKTESKNHVQDFSGVIIFKTSKCKIYMGNQSYS